MKPDPFALVIEHQQRRRDAAVGEQVRARTALAQARQTLDTLVGYRDEQFARARTAGAKTVAVARLVQQARFAGTLEEAIAQQRHKVTEQEARLARCTAAVQEAEQRLRALETVVERRRAAIALRAARREQQATDELATNRHARATAVQDH